MQQPRILKSATATLQRVTSGASFRKYPKWRFPGERNILASRNEGGSSSGLSMSRYPLNAFYANHQRRAYVKSWDFTNPLWFPPKQKQNEQQQARQYSTSFIQLQATTTTTFKHQAIGARGASTSTSTTTSNRPNAAIAVANAATAAKERASTAATTAKERASNAATVAKERASKYSQHYVQQHKKKNKSMWEMWNQYGFVFLGSYFTVYMSALATFYVGIDSGWLDPISWGLFGKEAMGKSTALVVSEFMEHYSWTKPYAEYVKDNPRVANLGLAWISIKPTEPVRLASAMFLTPRVANYLGYVKDIEAEDAKGTRL